MSLISSNSYWNTITNTSFSWITSIPIIGPTIKLIVSVVARLGLGTPSNEITRSIQREFKGIRDGNVIDTRYITQKYPRLRALVRAAPRELREGLEAEAQKLVNRNFLIQFQNKQFHIPLTLKALSNFIHIKDKLNFEFVDFDSENCEPADLDAKIRKMIFQYYIEDEFFVDVAIELQKIELLWENLKIEEETIRVELIQEFRERIDCIRIYDVATKSIILSRITQFIRDMQNPDNCMKRIILVIHNSKIDEGKEHLETFKELVKKELHKFSRTALKSYLDGQIEKHLVEIMKEYDWMKMFKVRQVVDYYQEKDGLDEILGKGCCFAINLKWGRFFATNGTKVVQSTDLFHKATPQTKAAKKFIDAFKNHPLLDPMNAKNDDQCVEPSDRFQQANYSVAFRLNGESLEEAARKVLAKDNFDLRVLPFYQKLTLGEVLTELTSEVELHPQGSLYLSMVEINTGRGHGIGCKIDFAGKLFRFWDVNCGVFQTHDFSDFCKAFDAYILENYNGEDDHWVLSFLFEIYEKTTG